MQAQRYDQQLSGTANRDSASAFDGHGMHVLDFAELNHRITNEYTRIIAMASRLSTSSSSRETKDALEAVIAEVRPFRGRGRERSGLPRGPFWVMTAVIGISFARAAVMARRTVACAVVHRDVFLDGRRDRAPVEIDLARLLPNTLSWLLARQVKTASAGGELFGAGLR